MSSATRNYSWIDKICLSVDQMLRTLTNQAETTAEIYPGHDIPEADLNEQEKNKIAALMRVNHSGEVSAQALYHGQALVTQSYLLKNKLHEAALEEGNHLAWCKTRLDELQSHTSVLNPIWYAGSFCIGMMAGMVGDKWSLGFISETEKQVVKHLESHLQIIPTKDVRTIRILEKMSEDEATHRDDALSLGAISLPTIIQKTMSFTSKIMVKTSFWI